MSLVKGKCPLCGASIEVPNDMKDCYCNNCGEKIIVSAAISFADRSKSHVTNVIQPSNKASSSHNDAGNLTNSENENSEETQTPFLSAWKTDYGAVIGGIALSFVLYISSQIFDAAAPSLSSAFYDGYMMISVITFVISIPLCLYLFYYVFLVYPSLFDKNPKLKSSALVSFLNGFLGGPIFGPLFCSNLTKKTKGVSYIVLGVLLIFLLTVVIISTIIVLA